MKISDYLQKRAKQPLSSKDIYAVSEHIITEIRDRNIDAGKTDDDRMDITGEEFLLLLMIQIYEDIHKYLFSGTEGMNQSDNRDDESADCSNGR